MGWPTKGVNDILLCTKYIKTTSNLISNRLTTHKFKLQLSIA